jgi:hypothetical protein
VHEHAGQCLDARTGVVDEAGLPDGQRGHDGEDGQRAADGQLKQGPAPVWRHGQRGAEGQRGEHQQQRGYVDQGAVGESRPGQGGGREKRDLGARGRERPSDGMTGGRGEGGDRRQVQDAAGDGRQPAGDVVQHAVDQRQHVQHHLTAADRQELAVTVEHADHLAVHQPVRVGPQALEGLARHELADCLPGEAVQPGAQ